MNTSQLDHCFRDLLERLSAKLNENREYPVVDFFFSLITMHLASKKIFPRFLLQESSHEELMSHLEEILEKSRDEKNSCRRMGFERENPKISFDVTMNSFSNNGIDFRCSGGGVFRSISVDINEFFKTDADPRNTSECHIFCTKIYELLIVPIQQKILAQKYDSPRTVTESSGTNLAPHLRIVFDQLYRDQGFTRKEVLIALIVCIMSERKMIPIQLGNVIEYNDTENFDFNQHFCNEVASRILLIIREARDTSNPIFVMHMIHPNSDISFDVSVIDFDTTHKVTFKNPPPLTGLTSSVFDMRKCVEEEDSMITFNTTFIEYSDRIVNALFYPVLTQWWQKNYMYTRLPYLLGIPENCLLRIKGLLDKRSRKAFRLTNRMIARI